MPTKRQYSVDLPKANSQLTSNGYILRVNVKTSKKAKQEPPREFTQYADIRYARADAARLEDHYLANKRLRSFQPDYDGAIYSSLSREQRSRGLSLTAQSLTERVLAPKNGIVIKQAKQRAERMYRKYAKQAGSEALNIVNKRKII